MRRIWTACKTACMLFGLAAGGLTAWLALGWPVGLDRWLDVGQAPVASDAVICLGGGTTIGNLPLDRGWDRIRTTAELFVDHYAPVVVFSGSGSTHMSEAEVYADAAAWLGIPHEAIAIDARPRSTAEHAESLIGLTLPGRIELTRDTRLLVVTSWFHARRALGIFRHAGFTHVRVITSYQSTNNKGPIGRHRRPSALHDYVPLDRRYDDPLMNVSYGYRDFFIILREFAALAWYWHKGWI